MMPSLKSKLNPEKALQMLEETQKIAKLGGWELDLTNQKVVWTNEVYRIFETNPNEFELTVDAVLEYFLPESQKSINEALDAAIYKKTHYGLEIETYTLKGRKIDVRATAEVIQKDGKATKISGFVQDITELANQRRELEQNLMRLKVATDSAEMGVWEYNVLDGSILWDERMYALYGSSSNHFTASFSSWENSLSPEDLKLTLHKLNQTVQKKQPFRTEFRVTHPDGSVHWIAANGYPMQNDSGQVIKVIGTNQNIDRIKEYEDRIETSQRFAKTGYWEWNFKTGDVYWSPIVVEMYGGPNANITTTYENFDACLHPDDRQLVTESVNTCIEKDEQYNIQHRIIWPDGSIRWIAAQGDIIRDNKGEPERMLGMAQDITQQKEIEDALLTQSLIVTNMEEAAALIRVSDQTMVYTNPAFDAMFGFEAGEAHGQHVSTLHAPNLLNPEDEANELLNQLRAKGVWRGEVKTIKKDGTVFWSSLTTSAFDHPLYEKVRVSVLTDITERKSLQDELSYQASHDTLTGLISRYEFEKRITRLISNIPLDNTEHAMCFLDLDQFKVINDTCGHIAGDELLRQLGSLLVNIVRKQDTLARLGGDEFGILMEHCTLEQAERTANEVLAAVRDYQFFWDGKTFRIGVSIGLVKISKDSGNFSVLLSQADAACYLAKDLGRNRIHTYHPDDSELAIRHGEMQWVGRISNALDEGRFCLYVQAIMSLKADNSKHYEVLVRMLDTDDSIIPPGSFLPAAERYNLIQKIDAWVISHTFEFLAQQLAFTNELEFISINLSGQSLSDKSFLDYVIKMFEETNISPSKICFEVTETAAVSNMTSAIKFITRLKNIGCKFALDDFGSGISSFGYLKSLPVYFLKIDGMFVKDMVTDPIDFAMVKSINEVGQVMGMKTIAEFVENDDIITSLKALGVNFGQGYGIGKPEPLKNLIEAFPKSSLPKR
jgi:diguanylate cyclase (GGDEF)-like protein/PAS domain S-box-containing protein